MAKTDSTQKALDRLSELEEDGHAIDEIADFLSHKSNHVVGKAASIIQEMGSDQFDAQLEENFFRFMKNPIKSDPTCVAKRNIIKCLLHMGSPAESVYKAGLAHIQMEPAFGPPVDTAPGLRGDCGRALAKIDHPDTFRIHASLIMDSEPETRRIAINTLIDLATIESEILLRTKILSTDLESDILADCFTGLMQIAPHESLEFVALHLASPDLACAHGAALALGESHHPKSFELLKQAWENESLPLPQYELLLPIALGRSDEAFNFLLDQMDDTPEAFMTGYLDALSVFSGNDQKRETIFERLQIEKSPNSVGYWRKIVE